MVMMTMMMMIMMMIMRMMVVSQESQVCQLEAVGVGLRVCAGALPTSVKACWYPRRTTGVRSSIH